MFNDNKSKAYTKKKLETYHNSPISSKDDTTSHPNLHLALSSGLNDSIGFSTLIDNNESEDIRLLHYDKKEAENFSNRNNKSISDDYSAISWNVNYNNTNQDNSISNHPSMISKNIQLKHPINSNSENNKNNNNHLRFLHPSNSSGNIDNQINLNNPNLFYAQNRDEDYNENLNTKLLQYSNTNSIGENKRNMFANKKSANNANTFSFKNFKLQQQQQQQQQQQPQPQFRSLTPLKHNEMSKDQQSIISIKRNAFNNHCNNNNNTTTKKAYNKRHLDNYTKCKEVLIQEIVDEDELTPLPVRKEKRHPIAEHDYNQAHSAAILIRRIEYSYHLKTCRKFKNYGAEIIYIQRWWRRVLAHRNENLLQDLIDNELRNTQHYYISEDYNRYIKFLSSIERVYDWHKIKSAFKKLYINFAHLAWYNNSCYAVNLIIRNYRKFALKLKQRAFRKLKYYLIYHAKRIYIRKIIQQKKKYEEQMNKIKLIQAIYRGFMLRNKEKNQLRLGRDNHPFLFYTLRYKRNHTNKSDNFKKMIGKWKSYVRKIKLQRTVVLSNSLQKFFFKFYFAFFLMKIIKKTNAILTLIQLRPHKKFIFGIYKRSLLNIQFNQWKRMYALTKRPCLIIIKTVNKMIGLKALKPLIRKYKHRITLNNFISQLFAYVNNEFNHSKILSYNQFKRYYNRSVKYSKHTLLLHKIIRKKARNIFVKYFNILRLKSMYNSRNILLMKYGVEQMITIINKYFSKCYQKAKEKQVNSSFGLYLLSQCFKRNKFSYRIKRIILFSFPKQMTKLTYDKWKGIIEKITKLKTAKLYEVSRFLYRQKQQLFNHYLFRYMKNSSHPQKTKTDITQGLQIITPIFERKHVKYIYHTFNKGHRRTCLKLFMKTIITIFKSKINSYQAAFISDLKSVKQKQLNQQSKSRDLIHFKVKDEKTMMLNYYFKWMKITIKENNLDYNDYMSEIQLNKLKKVLMKSLLLKKGSVKTVLSFNKWRHIAQKISNATLIKSYWKKNEIKSIFRQKEINTERNIHDCFGLWRSITSILQSNTKHIINAINCIVMMNQKSIGKLLLSFMVNKYKEDKRQLLLIAFTIKSNKNEQYLKVYMSKWRKSSCQQALDDSIRSIQGFIRKQISSKRVKVLKGAIKKIYNHRLLFLLKIYFYGAIIGKFVKEKKMQIIRKRYTQWYIVIIYERNIIRKIQKNLREYLQQKLQYKQDFTTNVLKKFIMKKIALFEYEHSLMHQVKKWQKITSTIINTNATEAN